MNEHHSKKMDESLKSDYRNNVLFCISNTWKIHYPRALLYIYIGRPSMNLVSIVLIPLPCNTSQLTDYMCAGLGRKVKVSCVVVVRKTLLLLSTLTP